MTLADIYEEHARNGRGDFAVALALLKISEQAAAIAAALNKQNDAMAKAMAAQDQFAFVPDLTRR
jgi:hypothetical protein